MPRGDETGPNGQGALTGRGMGYCAGFNTPGFMNQGFGRGWGRGRGFAWRARVPIQLKAVTEKEEKELLKEELKEIEEERKEIEKRLKELK